MAEAGTIRQNYVPGGATTVGFTPDPGAAEQIETLTEQLEAQLKTYRADIAGLVKPWSDRWAQAQDWGAKIALLQDARDRGLNRGATAWTEDQVGFLEQVGGWMSGAGNWIVEQGENLTDWYGDLPMLGKVFPGAYAAGELAGEAADASEEIQRLWAQRQALLNFFKALYEQSVDAVQIAIETLSKMGGKLGQLMQALWDHGAEWVQGLIEVCRQTDVIQRVFASIGALFAALPPNLWAEGISTGAGYIVPELLVAVVLAALAAITEGAAAPALAARLMSYGAKLRGALSKLGELGRILLRIYDGVKTLGAKIAELVRAVWRNIDEAVEGAVDRSNRVVRASRAARTGEFTPLGVRADPLKSQEGRTMLRELAKEDPDASLKTLNKRAKANLQSGRTLPEIGSAETGTELMKAVPRGDGVGSHSPFFATREEIAKLAEKPEQLADNLGLPTASESSAYDLYSITPKEGRSPTTFTSEVASTVEGSIRRQGGATQTVVPYRGDWTEPVYKRTIGSGP